VVIGESQEDSFEIATHRRFGAAARRSSERVRFRKEEAPQDAKTEYHLCTG
jgi:hypothetical protein